MRNETPRQREGSPGVSQFSSQFDYWRGSGIRLSKEEQRGFALFQGKGKCARCHVSSGRMPLFTDFTYDNLGVPVNPDNPAVLADPSFRDPGLGGFLERMGMPAEVCEPETGKVKVPTLRGVDKRPSPDAIKAFSHNGYFKSLESLVNFYNTRDVKPACPDPLTREADALAMDCWPAPEIADNVNSSELGDLGLSDEEEDAIVAFLGALSDGFVPQVPREAELERSRKLPPNSAPSHAVEMAPR